MSDIVVDLASLSEDVREKLAELDLELSEGMYNTWYLGVRSNVSKFNLCYAHAKAGGCRGVYCMIGVKIQILRCELKAEYLSLSHSVRFIINNC